MAQTKAQLLGPVVGDVVMDVSTLSLDAEGNKVGIGHSEPDLTLHVSGVDGLPSSSGSTATGHLTLRDKSNSTKGMFLGVSDASPFGSWIQAQDSANNATNYPLLLNPNGGNIGIGTDNPSRILHVSSNNDQYIRVTSTTSGNAGIEFGDAADQGRSNIVYANSDDSMSFTVNGSPRLSITSAGLLQLNNGNQITAADTTTYIGLGGGNSTSNGANMFLYGGSHASNASAFVFRTNTTERFRIKSDGNVGINDTNPTSYANSQVTLVIKDDTNPAICLNDTGQTRDWWLVAQGDGLTVRYGDGGGSGSASNITSSMFFRDNGNVGINNTDPTRQLEIYNSSHATAALKSDTQSSLFFADSDTNIGQISYMHTGTPNNYMYFRVNDEERLRIDSNGELSISGSKSGLNVSDAILKFNILNSNGDSKKAEIKAIKTADISSELIFSTTASHTFDERMRIADDGNVGIGTVSPSARLHVHSGTNDTPVYLDTSNANGAHIRFLQGGSVRHFLGCGGGISLGDKDDLTMRAYDNIIFATSNTSTRKATLKHSGEFIIGTGTTATGSLHVTAPGITASAPSEGWPNWNAENDTNAKIVAQLETDGNGNNATTGYGATAVLRLCQYYDSRAVITPQAGGGASPSDQGTAHGKDLMVKGGRSDNANGRNGGRLFLDGGSGYNGSFNANFGDVILQSQGGFVGLNGQTNPEYPFDLIDGNNRAYFTQGSDSTMSLVMYDNSSHRTSIQAYGGQLRLNVTPTAGGSFSSCMRFNTEGDAIIGQGFNEDPTANRRLIVKDTNSIVRIESPGSASGEYTQLEFKTGSTSAWIWKNPTSNTNYGGAGSLNIYHTQNADIAFLTNGNNVRFKVRGDGYLQVGTSTNNFVKNQYQGSVSVTGTNNESFAFEIQGSAYASGGLLFVYGTSGNVVVNVSAEILVNHSNDVTIKSMSGAYTQARIRVKTDSNARAAIYLGRNAGYASGTTSLNWRFIPYGGTYLYTTESTNNGTDHTHTTSSGSFKITAAGGGSANVAAQGSKTFLIDHPLESLRETTRLAHAAVEGPECNTMYRGKVDLVDGTATVNIDTNSRMTEGTFVALNQNVQCFTTNETGWTAIKGSVSGNLLTITAQDNTCTDTISWMVVGERKDQDIVDNRATDSEGRLITEITDEYDASQFAAYTNPVEPELEPDNTEERDPTV